MKKLTYITDLVATPSGGGSYAVNWHMQEELRKYFELHTPLPIVPEVSSREEFMSRVQRYVLKRPGKFFYFSPSTLDSNATRVSSCLQDDVDGVFFRSASRWCHCRPRVPYFVYLDVVFHTFFENTFDKHQFVKTDLQRIFQSEARFLENASAVFFESNWGMQKAKDAYGLTGSHYFNASRGGVIDPPDRDVWTDENPFILSIAKNFEQKGGDIILSAFKKLKEQLPELEWHIVGGRPTGDWESVRGIIYEGVLSPDKQKDLARFRELLSKAFLLVHPTREDTSPLVITEAAYFGCPTISVNRFAIPELVLHGETGILLNWPVNHDLLSSAILNLIRDRGAYLAMRRAARKYALDYFQWDKVGEQIAEKIREILK